MYMENCSNIFFQFHENVWLTKEFYPFFHIGLDFFISVAVIYLNITPDSSAITRCKDLREITVA